MCFVLFCILEVNLEVFHPLSRDGNCSWSVYSFILSLTSSVLLSEKLTVCRKQLKTSVQPLDLLSQYSWDSMSKLGSWIMHSESCSSLLASS